MAWIGSNRCRRGDFEIITGTLGISTLVAIKIGAIDFVKMGTGFHGPGVLDVTVFHASSQSRFEDGQTVTRRFERGDCDAMTICNACEEVSVPPNFWWQIRVLQF